MTSRKVSWGCFVSSAWQSWPKLNLSPSLIKLLKPWFFILFPENWNSLVRVFFIFIRIVCWKHSWWHYVLHLTSYICLFCQNFCPLMQKLDSLEKTLMLQKTEGRRKKGTTEDEMIGWHHWLNGHSLSKLREVVKDKEAWHAMVHGAAKSQTWLSNWTTTTIVCLRKKNTIDSSTEKEREGHETSVVKTIPE